MSYKDYQAAIKRYYHFLGSTNNLPQRLLHPTPAKLREECVEVFRSRYRRPDEKTVRTFFRITGEITASCISRFDIDKFRPLVNYLNDEIDTADKNIELLAWLIDFPNRPFDRMFDYERLIPTPVGNTQKKENNRKATSSSGFFGEVGTGEDSINWEVDGQSEQTSNERDGRKNSRRRFIAAAMLLLIGGLTYVAISGNPQPIGRLSSDLYRCMVWSSDHYQMIDCDSLISHGNMVPYNQERFKHLQKINRPDTIRIQHISNIWYQKRGRDSVEYYTAGGNDPLHPERYLKPLSLYMYRKYLEKDDK